MIRALIYAYLLCFLLGPGGLFSAQLAFADCSTHSLFKKLMNSRKDQAEEMQKLHDSTRDLYLQSRHRAGMEALSEADKKQMLDTVSKTVNRNASKVAEHNGVTLAKPKATALIQRLNYKKAYEGNKDFMNELQAELNAGRIPNHGDIDDMVEFYFENHSTLERNKMKEELTQFINKSGWDTQIEIAKGKSTPLNKVAGPVKQKLGAEIIFDSKAMISDMPSSKAYYDKSTQIINPSLSEVMSGKVKGSTLHEIKHAKHQSDFIKGSDSVFQSEVSAPKNQLVSKVAQKYAKIESNELRSFYGSYASSEELANHVTDASREFVNINSTIHKKIEMLLNEKVKSLPSNINPSEFKTAAKKRIEEFFDQRGGAPKNLRQPSQAERVSDEWVKETLNKDIHSLVDKTEKTKLANATSTVSDVKTLNEQHLEVLTAASESLNKFGIKTGSGYTKSVFKHNNQEYTIGVITIDIPSYKNTGQAWEKVEGGAQYQIYLPPNMTKAWDQMSPYQRLEYAKSRIKNSLKFSSDLNVLLKDTPEQITTLHEFLNAKKRVSGLKQSVYKAERFTPNATPPSR